MFKSLKDYLKYYIVILVLGLTLILVASVVGNPYSYITGVGVGFLVVSGIGIIKTIRINANPTKKQEFNISIKEERLIFLDKSAKSLTFSISTILELVLLIIIVVFFNVQQWIIIALSLLICVRILMYILIYSIYKKKY